jgi:hypothetical protein
MESDKYLVTWFVVKGERKTIQGDPLLISVEPDGSGLLLSEPVFGLVVPAKNVEEGIEGIRTQLSMLWDAYVEYPESGLSESGLELRNKLIKLVE